MNFSSTEHPSSERIKITGGLSLVELLVFVTIASLFLSVLWNLFRYTSTSVARGKQEAGVTRYFRLLALSLKDDLDNAESINIPDPGTLKINKVLEIENDGSVETEEVEYRLENSMVKRTSPSRGEKIFGDSENALLNFEASLTSMEKEEYIRYEVHVFLTGKAPGNSTYDSMEILVCPPMMSYNRLKRWNSNPE